jgi:membrane-bound acyltransferase YfiQ involved in biofilm formation
VILIWRCLEISFPCRFFLSILCFRLMSDNYTSSIFIIQITIMQGQFVMVRVVADDTVYVMLFCMMVVGLGQNVVYAVTTFGEVRHAIKLGIGLDN